MVEMQDLVLNNLIESLVVCISYCTTFENSDFLVFLPEISFCDASWPLSLGHASTYLLSRNSLRGLLIPLQNQSNQIERIDTKRSYIWLRVRVMRAIPFYIEAPIGFCLNDEPYQSCSTWTLLLLLSSVYFHPRVIPFVHPISFLVVELLKQLWEIALKFSLLLWTTTTNDINMIIYNDSSGLDYCRINSKLMWIPISDMIFSQYLRSIWLFLFNLYTSDGFSTTYPNVTTILNVSEAFDSLTYMTPYFYRSIML